MTNTHDTDQNLTKIIDGINPAFDALKAACLQRLQCQADFIRTKMEEHGWDIKAAFPYPKAWGMGRDDYHRAKANVDLARRLTIKDPDKKQSYSSLAPNYRIMHPDLDARFDKEAADYARMFIDAYAAKLTAKIAKEDKAFVIDTVKYEGTADPFAHSFLTVTGAQGTMVWKTKCIINQSKYGKLFNQWPTRKQK